MELEKAEKPVYTRQEVSSHKKGDDCWIIVNGKVYNVTSWLNKHPGGRRILQHYGGEDATVSNTSKIDTICILGGAENNSLLCSLLLMLFTITKN